MFFLVKFSLYKTVFQCNLLYLSDSVITNNTPLFNNLRYLTVFSDDHMTPRQTTLKNKDYILKFPLFTCHFI